MRRVVFIGLLVGCTLAATEWTSLFDGSSLDGWIQAAHVNGSAPYAVVEGCIVGTTKAGTPNSFLLAARQYANFVLELEFNVPQGMNSGVQFRSIYDPAIKGGRVHGYQVEIDPSERAWTGGIYDEARRGWLFNLTHIKDAKAADAARHAFRSGEWNHLRLEAISDRIRTWVNGVPVADLTDAMTRKGVIALQVHATGSTTPAQIRWRGIRIQDLGEGGTTREHLGDPAERMGVAPPAGATVLVGPDGTVGELCLDGKPDAPFPWKVVDGALEIVPGTGSVVSRAEFRDFRLHAEFAVNAKPQHSQDDGNSGFYIQRRYELQVLNSHGQPLAFNECAALYRTKAPDANASRPAGEWQSYDVVFRSPRFGEDGAKAENARISVSHNGVLVHDNVPIPNKTGAGRSEGPEPGPILLQNHGNPVRFRNVWVEELRTIDRAMGADEEQAHQLLLARDALRTYSFGDSRKPFALLEKLAQDPAPASRAALEAALVDLLGDAKATDDAKDFACQILARAGSAKAVPALAAALAVPRLSGRACIALAAIPGEESVRALRAGLGLPLPADAKGGVMNALSARGDRDAVALLAPFLQDADPTLVGSALAALGTLGGPDATKTLREAKLPAALAANRAEALLACARTATPAAAEAILADLTGPENLPRVRLGAYGLLCQLRGDEGVAVALELLAMEDDKLRALGGQVVPGLPGGTATTARLCTAIPALPDAGKASLLPALAARGDRSAAAAIQGMLAADAPLRTLAVEALGQLGDAAAVPLLLDLASPSEPTMAEQALVRLPDREADRALASVLTGAGEPPAKLVAARVLAKRGATTAFPALADTIASRADSTLSRECWKALHDLAPSTKDEFARLLDLLPGTTGRSELREAERTIAAVAARMAETDTRDQLLLGAFARTTGPAKATAVALLGKFPAQNSLKALAEALKDTEENTRYAAVKALMEWPDDAPADALLDFAKTTANPAHNVLAIQGYVRLVTLAIQSEDALKARIDAALPAARRDEEKTLLREALTRLVITDLKARNGKPYELVPKGFVKGGPVYIDRQYTFVDVPPILANADQIKTAMEDRASRAKDQTTFRISRPATVIVCYDNRAKTCPPWLKDWKKLDGRITTTDGACKLELYAKAFPAGIVQISGNSPVPNVSANHILAVTSAPLP